MIRPSGQVRVHLYRQPVDMRKAIIGLISIVEGEMDAAHLIKKAGCSRRTAQTGAVTLV